MQFGASTFIWVSPFSNRTLELMDRAKAMGFDILEICIEDPDTIDVPATRAKAAETGIGSDAGIAVPPMKRMTIRRCIRGKQSCVNISSPRSRRRTDSRSPTTLRPLPATKRHSNPAAVRRRRIKAPVQQVMRPARRIAGQRCRRPLPLRADRRPASLGTPAHPPRAPPLTRIVCPVT